MLLQVEVGQVDESTAGPEDTDQEGSRTQVSVASETSLHLSTETQDTPSPSVKQVGGSRGVTSKSRSWLVRNQTLSSESSCGVLTPVLFDPFSDPSHSPSVLLAAC